MALSSSVSSDVMRKTGKTTAVLQIFAVVLIGLLASVYSDISQRYSVLQNGIRENAMWSVYQLDREARRLEETLTILLAKADTGDRTLQELLLRYDILYSRIATLEHIQFEQNFTLNEAVRKQLQEIRRTVFRNAPLFDDIQAGKAVSLGSLRVLDGEFRAVVGYTEKLVTYTNATLSADRADSRNAVEALGRRSIVLIALLLLSVVFLIFTLHRQLRNVRAAGRSLESMTEKLKSSYQAAEAGNRAKSQFMATMGHEIRTPMNAILGMVELMELRKVPDDVANNLRTLRHSGEMLLDILNEILDFAKIEHGKLELEYRRVDVRSLAERSVEIMQGRAAEGSNRIELDISETLRSPEIVSDPTRLRQVILNLMSNALKFTSKGVVTLRIREKLGGPEPLLRVEVSDTGIGIDEAGRAKLFQPFSQVDASISRKYGGTGLGLTICKEIIDRFAGVMGVDSTPGKGSTFWFEVPAPPAEPLATSELASQQPDAPLPHLKILAVEDNKVNQQVISRFLSHLGQHVTVVENGAVAVDVASREQFDLVLMDMQMPVMDGIEATRRIRRLPAPFSTVPIIAMTANASEDDRQLCGEAGMNGFQSKPISLPQLRALLSGMKKTNPIACDTMLASSSMNSVDTAFELRRREMAEVLGEEEFQELVASFFDDAIDILNNLRAAMETGQHRQIEPLLHNLKGAAANVGLTDISAIAQELRRHEPTMADIETLAESLEIRRTKLAM